MTYFWLGMLFGALAGFARERLRGAKGIAGTQALLPLAATAVSTIVLFCSFLGALIDTYEYANGTLNVAFWSLIWTLGLGAGLKFTTGAWLGYWAFLQYRSDFASRTHRRAKQGVSAPEGQTAFWLGVSSRPAPGEAQDNSAYQAPGLWIALGRPASEPTGETKPKEDAEKARLGGVLPFLLLGLAAAGEGEYQFIERLLKLSLGGAALEFSGPAGSSLDALKPLPQEEPVGPNEHSVQGNPAVRIALHEIESLKKYRILDSDYAAATKASGAPIEPGREDEEQLRKNQAELQDLFLANIVAPLQKSLTLIHKYKNSNNLFSILDASQVESLRDIVTFNSARLAPGATQGESDKVELRAFSDPRHAADIERIAGSVFKGVWKTVCVEEQLYINATSFLSAGPASSRDVAALESDFKANCIGAATADGGFEVEARPNKREEFFKRFAEMARQAKGSKAGALWLLDPKEPYASIFIADVLLAADEKPAALSELTYALKKTTGEIASKCSLALDPDERARCPNNASAPMRDIYAYRLLTSIWTLYALDKSDPTRAAQMLHFQDMQIKVGQRLIDALDTKYLGEIFEVNKLYHSNRAAFGPTTLAPTACKGLIKEEWLKHLILQQIVTTNNFVNNVTRHSELIGVFYPVSELKSRLDYLSTFDLRCLESVLSEEEKLRYTPIPSERLIAFEAAIADTKAHAYYALSRFAAEDGNETSWRTSECASLTEALHALSLLHPQHPLFSENAYPDDEDIADGDNAARLRQFEKRVTRELKQVGKECER